MRVVYTGEPPAKLPPSLWSYRVDKRRVVVGGALSDGGGLIQWLVQTLNTGTEQRKLATTTRGTRTRRARTHDPPILVRRTKHRLVRGSTRRNLWPAATNHHARDHSRRTRIDRLSLRSDRERARRDRTGRNSDRNRQRVAFISRRGYRSSPTF